MGFILIHYPFTLNYVAYSVWNAQKYTIFALKIAALSENRIIHHLTTRQTANRFHKEWDVTIVASVASHSNSYVCSIMKKNISEGFQCPRAACVNINNVDDTSEIVQKKDKSWGFMGSATLASLWFRSSVMATNRSGSQQIRVQPPLAMFNSSSYLNNITF